MVPRVIQMDARQRQRLHRLRKAAEPVVGLRPQTHHRIIMRCSPPHTAPIAPDGNPVVGAPVK